jgi:hypothetical protein
VDYDPVVLAHARVLLAGCAEGATDYLDADLRDPETILENRNGQDGSTGVSGRRPHSAHDPS